MTSSAIVNKFRESAAKFPQRPATIGPEQSLNYRELERRSAAVAAQIAERVSGPVVGLLRSNTPAFVPLFLGALWAGKTVVVLPTLAPPPLLKLMATEAGAELVITSEEFVPRLMEVGVTCWIGNASGEAEPSQVEQRPLEQQTAVMLYTSGTTGRPKAVMLSETNLLDNAEGCRVAIGFDERDVMLAILPFFHAYGLTVTLLLPMVTGAALVVPRQFVPRAMLQLIEKHKVTAFVAVPGQYRVMAKEPSDLDVSSLRICIAGAERLPDQVAHDFENRFKIPILQGYGATEVAPVVSVNPPKANKLSTAGVPLPNVAVTIRDDEGRVLKPGEIGEVCVEGSLVMLGYYRDPEATARKIRDGVLHTGDTGTLDVDGYLHLIGREDDLVKIGGEKVYPSEVESALETLDGVDEAAVLAIRDNNDAVRLHAFVLLKPAATQTADGLRTACREILEPYKIPRTFSFLDQMPRTLTGKTDKRALASSAV